MRRKSFVIIILLAMVTMTAHSQPAAVKNVAKSVFALSTFRADGSLLATSHGVFVGSDGEAVSDLKPFLGAASAVVTDQKGRKMAVTHLTGIDAIYDAALFRVDAKTTPAPLATKQPAGTKAWVVGYSTKNSSVVETAVKTTEDFMEQYAYYIFGFSAPDDMLACPVVNQDGQVMGLLQVSTTSFDAHAADTRYATTLRLNALSYNDPNVQQIGIPIDLPADLQQAQLALMMAQQTGDSLKYNVAVDDFVRQFPTQTDGYVARARQQVSHSLLTQAEATMQDALKNCGNKAEAHYEFARLIYDYATLVPNVTEEKWTLAAAADETRQAIATDAQPAYSHLLGQVLFAQGNYSEALNTFQTLNEKSSFANGELLYEQARCKSMMQAPPQEIIDLLNQAISATDTLHIESAAPYFLARAAAYEQVDSFRLAAFDYTRYEILMRGRVSAQFYFVRSQAEMKGHLYQHALSDMVRAIALEPDEPAYYAELAQQQLRVNKPELALQTAQKCTEVDPAYPEGWLLLGLAQIRNGQKEQGLDAFRKAKELGSEQADALIAKYQ